jgi:linoleoyl-CoA desaturase
MSNETTATPKFPVMAKSLHAELKRRVNLYLEEHSVTATGNYKLFSKAIILLSLFVVTYIHLVFFSIYNKKFIISVNTNIHCQ